MSAVATIVAAMFPWIASAAETAEHAPPQAKVFEISPDDRQEDFMCQAGLLESVLATAENRVVTVILLDQSKAPIAEGAWDSAAGFRLRRKPQTKVRVMMFCGS
jgi:hypothetical protein